MSKDTFYFSHDYNARNDPKLQKVLMKMGQEGKGIYWDLIEMLYEQGGYLSLSDCESYAFQLRTQCDSITKLINGEFELFKKDENRFWSESVLKRLDLRNDKSNKARQSANKRWNDANAMRTHSEGNAIKERKGKENKDNNIENISFEFYASEVLKAKQFTDQMSREYINLCNHICLKNKDGSWRLPWVLKIKNQISLDEFSKLYSKAGKNNELITTKIDSLQTNVKYHGKYTDLYLTINNHVSKSNIISFIALPSECVRIAFASFHRLLAL